MREEIIFLSDNMFSWRSRLCSQINYFSSNCTPWYIDHIIDISSAISCCSLQVIDIEVLKNNTMEKTLTRNVPSGQLASDVKASGS